MVASRNRSWASVTRFQHWIERIDGKQVNLLALGSSPAFPDAHHDGLQPTQHRVV
jgi:hypothetical protein